MKFRDCEVGWFVAYLLMAAFFIFAVLHFPSMQAIACKPNEEDCFRQWISALGGWAAVGAAIPTVYFLSKQISDAARHHRQTIAIQMEKRADIAASAIHSLANIDNLLSDWQVLLDDTTSGPNSNELEILERAAAVYNQVIFDEFEESFYFKAPLGIKAIRAHIAEKIEAHKGKKILANIVKASERTNVSVIHEYNKAVLASAADYRARFDRMIAD